MKKRIFLTALKRELFEELSIIIDLNTVIFLKDYSIFRDNKKILLNFFVCYQWLGEIKPKESQFFKWTTVIKLKNEKMLTSNKKIMNYLKINFSTN